MTRKKAKRQIFLPPNVKSATVTQLDEHRERRHDTDAEMEARIAQAEQEEKLEPIKLEDLPLKPMYWHVLIEPLRAKQKIGSLYLSEETKRVEEIQTTVGRIVAIGPCAFTGKTNAGNDLSLDIDRSTIVGKYVMYQKHVGQEIKLRSGHLLKLMDDSELLALVDDPDTFRHWL